MENFKNEEAEKTCHKCQQKYLLNEGRMINLDFFCAECEQPPAGNNKLGE